MSNIPPEKQYGILYAASVFSGGVLLLWKQIGNQRNGTVRTADLRMEKSMKFVREWGLLFVPFVVVAIVLLISAFTNTIK